MKNQKKSGNSSMPPFMDMGKPSPKPNQIHRTQSPNSVWPQCDERPFLSPYPSIYSLIALQNLFSKVLTLKKEML